MSALTIGDLRDDEAQALGRLMVAVYAALPGFPSPVAQPAYYAALAQAGSLRERPGVRVLVARKTDDTLVGGVVYFGDMAQYGSGGTATAERDAAGIRLLAVDPAFQCLGAGRTLTQACVELARAQGRSQVILHTTKAMPRAWGLYERMGFVRATDLDFSQQGLPVFGFRLALR